MPKSTFYNLPEEKRQMIEAALLNSFYNQHISQVKVAQIVAETKISRAAFYKYFPTLEDAHQYIINKIAKTIHRDIFHYIEENKRDFFGGIAQYLRYCSELSHDSDYWKGIKLLIKGENTILYRRMEAAEENRMVREWLELLRLNNFSIQKMEEAMGFLYFVMELVVDSLASLIVNDWATEEILKDFSYKSNWLLKGIK
ncbi:TetR/AcrR family transcriptional regulator [uncultured Enterococcus sp.]|uniref:TetR/AcrR family transcriptional regulator n=1 Tax=uncultured Enterococcus sp. TaxID=167972 RepID=UPI002AA61032|nr:TetR/AcrR family transcriptional regulator [uncultured Enterococcus sp.]